MSTPATQKKHHKFKMPHILFLVLILLFVLSALTYIIPAGQFAKDEMGITPYSGIGVRMAM